MLLIRSCAIALSSWLLAEASMTTLPALHQSLASEALAQAADSVGPSPRLSPFEAAVLREINRARTNPNAYADWLERQRLYYDGNVLRWPRQAPIATQEGPAALEEAIRFLRQARPLLPLESSVGLSLGLRELLTVAPSQPLPPTATSDFLGRVGRYGNISGPVSLNLSASRASARSLVMQLILDDGNPNRDRRAQLFNVDYRLAGAACRPDSSDPGEQFCALAYVSSYAEDANRLAQVTIPPTPVTPGPVTPDPITPPAPVAPTPTPAPPPIATAPPPATRWLLVEQGMLDDNALVFPQDGTLYVEHTFRGQAGQSVVIRLESDEFDTFLAVFNEQGALLDQNDDTSPEDSNSTIEMILPYTGVYRIFVNGYSPEDRGRYTLMIR